MTTNSSLRGFTPEFIQENFIKFNVTTLVNYSMGIESAIEEDAIHALTVLTDSEGYTLRGIAELDTRINMVQLALLHTKRLTTVA